MKHENIVSVRAIIAASDGAEITYGGLCAAHRSVGAIVPDELHFCPITPPRAHPQSALLFLCKNALKFYPSDVGEE